MKLSNKRKYTRHILWPILAVCSLQVCSAAQLGVYQHGTVVRMRMGDCLAPRHGFMVAFGGPAAATVPEACPEYTLVSEKVVFVIVGRSSEQLVPLADVVDFRMQNTELAVRVDDARHESKFGIKEMILRSQWDMVQKHLSSELNAQIRAADTGLPARGVE